MKYKNPNIFSQEQVEALILAALAATPTTQERLESFLEWSKNRSIDYTLIGLALKGHFKVDVTHTNPDEWLWSKR